MAGYVLPPAAQANLSQIWDYTATHWGEAHAAWSKESPTSPQPSPPPGAERESKPALPAFPLRPLGGGGQGEVGMSGPP